MDLRRQLVLWLGACLLGLMVVTAAISAATLRGEVAREVAAAERLALALLAGQRDGAVGGLRHISISDAYASAPATDSLGARVARWLEIPSGESQLLRVDGRLLRIAPDPASEVEERLNDVVHLWSTLLVFSAVCLVLAWWVAQRALAPVRALEAGLRRLADGERDAAMPPFALREFARVAAGIDQLAAALAEAQGAQQGLAQRLIRVQEQERRTLAMELHDEMGQTLTAIGLGAAYMERHAATLDANAIVACAGELRRDVRCCGAQLRAMLARLRPHMLDGESLAPALRALVQLWRQRAGHIAFSLGLPDNMAVLDQDTSLLLYRVVQEALTNVVRHSGARHCQVRVAQDVDGLTIMVTDDGRGLAGAGKAGCGLAGMAERVSMAGGHLAIEAAAGGGVCLRAHIALRERRLPEAA